MGRKYWVVGSFWGREDTLKTFIKENYWCLGWTDDEQPGMAELRDQMQPGDRIVVKKMLGQGATEIAIRALGVVEKITDDKIVYVAWCKTGLDCRVESRGAFKAIHGPYDASDVWVSEMLWAIICQNHPPNLELSSGDDASL